MKTKLNKILFIFVLLPILLITVTYASFSEEVVIDGEAVLRVEENIRITDIKVLEQTNGAYETYNNKYHKERTSMFITLPNTNSTITYQVTITNNSNIRYDVNKITIENYGNSSIKYNIDLSVGNIIESNTTKTFTIKFYYEETTLPNDITNTLILKYEFVEHIDSYVAGTYDYTGKEEKFIVPYTGIYKIEAWGAEGGKAKDSVGGYGSYSVGYIELTSNDILSIVVGEKGEDCLSYSFG